MRANVSAGVVRRELIDLCSQGQVMAAYMRLLDSGLDAPSHPGLWEMLERRAVEAGDALLAHRIRRNLLDADVAGIETVLNAVRHDIENGQLASAREYIEDAFGAAPENIEARILLGVALAPVDREKARHLLKDAENGTEVDMLLAVDALRAMGELKEALRLCKIAIGLHPQDPKFSNRLGWIAEGIGDYATARTVAASKLGGDNDSRAHALNRLVRLHRRLGEKPDAVARAAELLRLETGPLQKLRLAKTLGQPRLVENLVCSLPVSFAEGQIDADEAERIATFLVDEGQVGLALYLWRKGLPIGDAERQLLERRGYGRDAGMTLPRSFEEALSIRSPGILFPLYPERMRTARPAGSPLRETDRILLVNPVLAAGGAERQFLMVARALVAAGISPDRLHAALFSIESDRGHDHFEAALRATGIHVHDLSARDVSGMALPERERDIAALLPARLRSDTKALYHLAKQLEPAVIHGWQDRAALAAGLVGQMLNVRRTVLSVRNMRPVKRGDDSDWIAHSVYGELLAAPSVVITANASEGARDYEDWLGLSKGSVSVLANAVDETVFSSRPGGQIPDGPVRILGVFRLTENKRPLLWLETIAALRNKLTVEIAPHIVGAGPMADEIKRSAERLGLNDLRLQAPVPDPSEIYRNSDVLLLMSRVEGTPNVVLEAQACGIPVAACRVGGVADALHVDGAGPGLLLEAEIGADDAASAIAQWLPSALAAPSEPRVEFIREYYSMPALARTLLGLYGART